MKLAFSKPTGDDSERHLLFSRFQSHGYDGLQLKRGQFSDYLDAPERFTQDWGHYQGIASGLIMTGTLEETGVSLLRKVFKFAQSVKSERIIFCHRVSRQGLTSVDIKNSAKILSKLGNEAEQFGAKLSLHHHYDQPVMYRADFDVFFDAVEGQSVGLTVDTAHLVKSGIEDVAELIQDFRHVIDNIHLKDFADGEFKVLGQGRINFTPVFSAIQEVGYNGWLCADEESGGDIPGTMKTCSRFLKEGLSSYLS